MKVFKFFIKEIFLKKILVAIGVFLMIFLSNYLVFTAMRSALSTLEGYKEVSHLNQENSFISNLDPESNFDMGAFSESDFRRIYDYLDENFSYGMFANGFIVTPPNSYNMEASCAYINETYYRLNKFRLSQGTGLEFDYDLKEDSEIPVIIGSGLSKDYPLDSTIQIVDPALSKDITLRVKGILEQDYHRSNIYALNSKEYYNFSIIIPANKEFIDQSNIGLQDQGLSDMIILDTSENKIESLKETIYENTGLKYNFFTQEENFGYFKEYYIDSLRSILIVSIIISLVLILITIWCSLSGINMMIKDFTINLFAGLSYKKLRKILYGYYGILFVINLLILYAIIAFSNRGYWLRKEILSVSFGILGLTNMDWLALIGVIIFDLIIGVLIVEILLHKIKKVPISLGVLQWKKLLI